MNEFPSFPFIIYPDSNSKITQLSKVLPLTCKNALDIKKIFIKKVKDSKPLKLLNEITLLKQELNIQKEKDASNFFKLDFSPSINSINKALNEKKSLLKVQIAELNEIHSLTQKYKTCYERCHLIAKKILRSKNNSNLEKELIHLTKIVLPSIRNIQKTKIKSFNLKYNEKTMFYLDKTIVKDLSSDIYSEIITDELNKYFEVKFGLNKNSFSKLGIQFCFSKNDVQALIQELKNNFPIIFSNRNNNKPVNFESDLKYELSQFFKKLGGENENPNFSISLLKENLAILIAKDLIEIFLNKRIIIEDETDLT